MTLGALMTAPRLGATLERRPTERAGGRMFKTEAKSSSSADRAHVWAVLMDVPNWPRWNPGYVAAEAEGPLGLGRRGVVTLVDGRRSPFEVFECDEMRYLTIGGRAPATDIRFQYRLEDDATGGTRITLGHTLEGILSPLFARLFGRRVAGYLPTAAAQLARMSRTSQP